MNRGEHIRWTSRRWTVTILAALFVQVGLLAWLGRGSRFQSAAPDSATVIHVIGDRGSVGQIERLPTYRDPALFALPSLQGFSGTAWLTFHPPENTLRIWSEPIRTLSLDSSQLAAGLRPFVATDTVAPLSTADQPTLRITGSDAFVPNQPVETASRLRLEGGLAARTLLDPSPLPSWSNRDILSNSVVQLTVLASGEPLSVALLSGSGLTAADRHALDYARNARFVPWAGSAAREIVGESLASGQMVFCWYTRPIATTNAVPPL